MRNLLITLAVALAACAMAFGVFYVVNDVPALHRAVREQDAMAWLQVEFHLNDAQFAAIKKLHENYGTVCAEHCAAIMAARKRAAPPAEIAVLEETCVRAMTGHFHRVAALMTPGEGERYLAIVLPRVAVYDHAGAPNLQVRP